MPVSKLVFLVLALALETLGPRIVSACGVCYEDDLASVYTYEAYEKAERSPQDFEFVVLKVHGPLSSTTRDKLWTWLAKRQGIDPSTVNISLSQKAIGFVFSRKQEKGILFTDIHQRFPNLSFHLIRYDSPNQSASNPKSI